LGKNYYRVKQGGVNYLYFEKPKELENYRLVNVKGDGNCFYRAIGASYNNFKENDEGYKVVK
jgi:hypothetical protein